MLKLSAIAATVLFVATPAVSQDRAFGNPNWIPGQTPSTLTLYQQSGLQGDSTLIVESEGNLSGRTASLRATGGSWEVCDRPNFRGQCRIVDGWALSLNRDIGLRNIRSVRPLAPEDASRN